MVKAETGPSPLLPLPSDGRGEGSDNSGNGVLASGVVEGGTVSTDGPGLTLIPLETGGSEFGGMMPSACFVNPCSSVCIRGCTSAVPPSLKLWRIGTN